MSLINLSAKMRLLLPRHQGPPRHATLAQLSAVERG
jgi:hypothetical protein